MVVRDFTARALGAKLVGDITQIDTGEAVGRTCICFDNAMAESFFGKLKTESRKL